LLKILATLAGCLCLLIPGYSEATMPSTDLDDIAESFVKLTLALGQHDPDYVDAYFGPEAWRLEVEKEGATLDEIIEQARSLSAGIASLPLSTEDAMLHQRQVRLARAIASLDARARLVAGEQMPFDEESEALFDAVAPTHSASYFQSILEDLDSALPGEGELIDRYSSFKAAFVVPIEKLDTVFQAAIEACRERTRAFIDLPADESFVIEYVTDKSWSGYNWYQGDFHSLIQVNTDLPIHIDRALDLACHEGYPGHHVFNLLLEKNLLRDRGWSEFFIYPLFSPRSLIAEGTANFGIEVAFPDEARLRFESEILFPLAGMDPKSAADYYRIESLKSRLDYAGNEAARGFLDGVMDAEQAIDWLVTYALMPEERARQRLSFIEQYRSYVINYNLGLDMVRNHIESQGGTADNPDLRWQLFADLLSNPSLPSQLK
jgi:hypothetical protein